MWTYDRFTQTEDGNTHPLETYTYSNAGDSKRKTASGLVTGTYGCTNHWLTGTGRETRTYDATDYTLGSQQGGTTYGYIYDHANHLLQVQANGAAAR